MNVKVYDIFCGSLKFHLVITMEKHKMHCSFIGGIYVEEQVEKNDIQLLKLELLFGTVS